MSSSSSDSSINITELKNEFYSSFFTPSDSDRCPFVPVDLSSPYTNRPETESHPNIPTDPKATDSVPKPILNVEPIAAVYPHDPNHIHYFRSSYVSEFIASTRAFLSSLQSSDASSSSDSELNMAEVEAMEDSRNVCDVSSAFTSHSVLEAVLSSLQIAREGEGSNGDYSLGPVPQTDRVMCQTPPESPTGSFIMYKTFFELLNVRLPFSDFEVDILRSMDVAPIQLHLNSWAFIRSFDLLCKYLGIIPSSKKFFFFFFRSTA